MTDEKRVEVRPGGNAFQLIELAIVLSREQLVALDAVSGFLADKLGLEA